jgi:hypothetical protein
MNFSLFELMNGVPSLLPLLGERGGVRGTAINANQKLNREGTIAAANLGFMRRPVLITSHKSLITRRPQVRLSKANPPPDTKTSKAM